MSYDLGTESALYFFGIKEAKLKTELKPHQQRVVARMKAEDQPGLVVVHGLGSGKTLTSIAVADALGLPADVVVPAALHANYQKELEKHTDKPPPASIQSLENVARKGQGALTNPLLIVDEAHRLRNPGKTQRAVMGTPANKRLALTGSLFYNHPADMAGPINLVSGGGALPVTQSEFEKKYIREYTRRPGIIGSLLGRPAENVVEINPARKGELTQLLNKYVDYHPGSTEGFPTRREEVVKVPMSAHQRKLYDAVMREAPPWVKDKVLKNLPPTKTEARQLNAFLTGVRQLSNTTAGFDTQSDPNQPKIERATAELKKLLDTNPNAKAIIYSNFLESGIAPYRRKLEEMQVPYGEFTGEMPKKVRDQLVRDYNEGKLKALLLSSAGGEGLDLKGTRMIQLLEPHWNEEKLKQVIGRGIRFKSHDHLPEAERDVLIQRYLATRPRAGVMEKMRLRDPGTSVDEYLEEMGQRKERLNQQFRDLLSAKPKK